MLNPIAVVIREKILALPKGSLLPVAALAKLVVKHHPEVALPNVYNRINKVMQEEDFAKKYETIKGRSKNESKTGTPKSYIRKKTQED